MSFPKRYDLTSEMLTNSDNGSQDGSFVSDTNDDVAVKAHLSGIEEKDGEDVQHNKYNLNKRSTFFITALSNKLTQHATTLLKKDFNIGLVDWRCIATLGDEISCSATNICKISGMNKSLVSMSLSNLRTLGYVVPDEASVCKNPEMLTLSDSGETIHQEIVKKVHHLEAELTEGLSLEERAEFIRLLTFVYNKMMSA